MGHRLRYRAPRPRGHALLSHWQNWAGEQRCAPALLARPRCEDEVVAAVRAARDAGATLRVAGSGHSFTDIVCTDGHLLSLAAMDRVLEADRDSGLVRVQAGITLHALGEQLAAQGLALENQGDIDAQALAGALATATHGTGARFANLSSRVAAMRLVDAHGDVVSLSAQDDPVALAAARVSLGALGVVTELTLRCVPAFTLERIDEPWPLARVLDELDELVAGTDHMEFWAFPYASGAMLRRLTRSDRAPVARPARADWIKERLENEGMTLAGRLARRVPGQVPRLNRALMGLVGRDVLVDRSHRVYASRRDVRFTEMEHAVPREHARAAIEAVLGVVEHRRLPVAFPIEVRFVAGDDALLSPAHGRDSCYIAVHQHRGQEFETYFRAVEEVLEPFRPRPHWGKRHYATVATLAPRYPQWDAFAAARDRFDPQRLFANAYLERVLGP